MLTVPIGVQTMRLFTSGQSCGLSIDPDGLVRSCTSWRGLFEGTHSRDFALGEYEVDASRSGADLDLRTVRRRRHRMSVDLLSGVGELYDLQEDPGEMRNIFEEPSARVARRELMDFIRSRSEVVLAAAPRVGSH